MRPHVEHPVLDRYDKDISLYSNFGLYWVFSAFVFVAYFSGLEIRPIILGALVENPGFWMLSFVLFLCVSLVVHSIRVQHEYEAMVEKGERKEVMRDPTEEEFEKIDAALDYINLPGDISVPLRVKIDLRENAALPSALLRTDGPILLIPKLSFVFDDKTLGAFLAHEVGHMTEPETPQPMESLSICIAVMLMNVPALISILILVVYLLGVGLIRESHSFTRERRADVFSGLFGPSSQSTLIGLVSIAIHSCPDYSISSTGFTPHDQQVFLKITHLTHPDAFLSRTRWKRIPQYLRTAFSLQVLAFLILLMPYGIHLFITEFNQHFFMTHPDFEKRLINLMNVFPALRMK